MEFIYKVVAPEVVHFVGALGSSLLIGVIILIIARSIDGKNRR